MLAPLVAAAALIVVVAAPSNVSRQSGYNGEGTIAVNPTDPTKVFAGFNNLGSSSQWARSSDRGMTWKKAGAGIGGSCCDNVAEWDRFGNLYLTNLNAAVNQVPLYLSTNGGSSFKQLALIDTGDVDQPSVKAGPDSVWVYWWNNGTIMARGAPVTGAGANNIGPFSSAESVPGSSNCQFGDVAVSPAGAVVVVCQTDTLIKSFTDVDGLGAGGFGAAVTATSTNVDRFDSITPQPNRTIDSEANLAYDLSSGTNAGRLYLVYTQESVDENNNTDIFLRHSDDDGATWSSAIKVNDDGTSAAQFFPVVTVDSQTGNLFVSFLDARNDAANNLKTEYWGAVSTDGGATFDPNLQLSAGQSAAANDGNPNEYGDYSGNDFYGGIGYGIWPDNSNSTGDNPDGTDTSFDMYSGKIDSTCLGSLPTIIGTSGDDPTLNGTGGDDVIVGLGGNDTINGNGGNDKICGGDGNDTFLEGASANGADAFSGGPGTDTISYASRTLGVTVTLDGKPKSGEKKEGDTVNADVENATGGSGGDKITGNGDANTLIGGAGKDKLVGGGASDTLNGTDGVEGNDSLDGSKEKPVPLADTCTADTATSKPDKIKNC